MTGENDRQGMSSDELREQIAAMRASMATNTGDRLRAPDLAAAVGDADTDKISDIVADVMSAGDTAGEGAIRTMNLLLAYIEVSVPFDNTMIARLRKQIVNEELDGITEEFGD